LCSSVVYLKFIASFFFFFFFNDTATTEIYTLSLHDALPIYPPQAAATRRRVYDMLLAEKLPVQGYHFPYPALARIEKQGNGYRVVPASR